MATDAVPGVSPPDAVLVLVAIERDAVPGGSPPDVFRARGGGGWTRSTMSCSRSLCTVPSTWRIIRAPSQNATRRLACAASRCRCGFVRTIEWWCLRARARAHAVSA